MISQSIAALSSGGLAPSFVLTDIKGKSYNLEHLAQKGKSVILHFGTTWCSTCWNLNQSKMLYQIDKKYGSRGSKELTILYIESDLNTDLNCLKGKAGCNSDTYGDWTRDSKFPIIDLDESNIKLLKDYKVDYYPMVYIITPDRRAFKIDITEEFDIEKYFEESIQLSIQPIVESNDCTGRSDISMSVDGGNGRLFFDWSTGSKASYIENVEPGSYGVTVTDENGVRQEEIIIVDPSIHPIYITNINVEDVSHQDEENGLIEVTAVGGIGDLSYLWDHGDAGNYISGLPPDTYHLTILDEENCKIRKTITVNADGKSDVKRTLKGDMIDLKVYPNPVANYLTVESENAIKEIKLLDQFGIISSNKENQYGETSFISVSHLEPGMYKILIVTDQSTTTKSFIKAR